MISYTCLPMPRRASAALGCAAAAVLVAAAACGGKPGANAVPTLAPGPIPVVTAADGGAPNASAGSAAAPAAAGPFTNQNWGVVTADPARYIGAAVSLSGQVFNVEQDATRQAVQMWTDPLHAQGNTVVVFPKDGFPVVKQNDEVNVAGTLESEFVGRSDSGEVLRLPRVLASSVSVTKAAAANASAGASARPLSSVAGASVSASGSPAAVLAAGIYRVANAGPNGLNIRRGANVNQVKIGVVHDGELVRVTGSGGQGWSQIAGDGFSGYAFNEYLTGPVQTSNPTLAKLSAK